jgi:hypothetical protein
MALLGTEELALSIQNHDITEGMDNSGNPQPNISELSEDNIDMLLKKIRYNCVKLSRYHNKRYHFYKNVLFSFFRVPIIIIGGFNSFVAVGMQSYLQQGTISLLNAMMSLLSAIITSIEILLNLQKRMENELESYKNYYKLGVEIYTFIELDPHERGSTLSKDFLKDMHKKYDALITTGNAINVYRRGFKDRLEDKLEIFEIPGDNVVDVNLNTCYGYVCNGCI